MSPTVFIRNVYATLQHTPSETKSVGTGANEPEKLYNSSITRLIIDIDVNTKENAWASSTNDTCPINETIQTEGNRPKELN